VQELVRQPRLVNGLVQVGWHLFMVHPLLNILLSQAVVVVEKAVAVQVDIAQA
jgi:hypothetical protein